MSGRFEWDRADVEVDNGKKDKNSNNEYLRKVLKSRDNQSG